MNAVVEKTEIAILSVDTDVARLKRAILCTINAMCNASTGKPKGERTTKEDWEFVEKSMKELAEGRKVLEDEPKLVEACEDGMTILQAHVDFIKGNKDENDFLKKVDEF